MNQNEKLPDTRSDSSPSFVILNVFFILFFNGVWINNFRFASYIVSIIEKL